MRKSWKLFAVLVSITWIGSNLTAQSPAPKSGLDPALMAKANAGNSDAEFMAGVQYELGARVAKDLKQAAAWYRKAADKGDVRAQHSLGVLYETGSGVAPDPAQAAQWYRKAAEKGFAPAQFSLALCYVHGVGVPQDYKQGLDWYQKAAQQNSSDALMNMAYLYANGMGVPKDDAKAFSLVRQAAEAGSADAQFQVGMSYHDGEQGLQPDRELATSWLQKSADQGHVAAMFNLAMLLKARPEEVYFWLSLATPHLTGSTKDKSKELEDAAAARLKPTELAQVDERVKTWHPVQEQH